MRPQLITQKRIDLFHNDVKRGKMKLTWNLIGSTFFANFTLHRESAFDVIIRKVYCNGRGTNLRRVPVLSGLNAVNIKMIPKVVYLIQEVSHAIPRASGNGTQPYDDISTPPIPIYETADGDESSDDTYQIIQEIVLPYVSIIESDKEEIQGDVGVTNSAYAELDSMKREPNDDSNYQKLIKQS